MVLKIRGPDIDRKVRELRRPFSGSAMGKNVTAQLESAAHPTTRRLCCDEIVMPSREKLIPGVRGSDAQRRLI
jgi:hypothetical protein